MGKVESRKDSIILILSNNTEYVTATELAKTLNVSEKTIYRTVKDINEDHKIPIDIISEKGKGYKIGYINKYTHPVTEVNDIASMTPIQRRNNVMQDLLIASPNERKIMVLYEDFYISDNLIRLDIKIIEKMIQQFDLTLTRSGQTLKVEGNENSIRKAISKLFQNNHLYVESLEKNIQDNSFDHDVSTFILKQINIIEKRLNSILPYPYNINIFSHLYILVKRYRISGRNNFKYDLKITENEKQEMNEYQSLNNVITEIINNINHFLEKELPIEEKYFLFQYLISSRFQGALEEEQLIDDNVLKIVDYYINEVAKLLSIDIESSKLQTNLYHHVKPLLNRLSNGFYVKNTLLDQIKYEYEKIYKSVGTVSKYVSKEFGLSVINDDEIGFITLYFAQYFEENPNIIDVIIVCTSGIGTSELLKSKIRKKFKNFNIVNVLSTKQLYENLEEYKMVDLVISTVKFKEFIPMPNIIVTSMLTVDDQERIGNRIKELNYD